MIAVWIANFRKHRSTDKRKYWHGRITRVIALFITICGQTEMFANATFPLPIKSTRPS